MNDAELCYLPATEALAAFRARTLSPRELMQAVIARAEAIAEPVNAFTFTYFEEALAAASAAEQRYAKGEAAGPLDGLPVGIKDESFIAGKPTSSGSLVTEDEIAERSSAMNERIMAAGGIVHARTATPEFSCAGYTWSRRWGITRNPWNPEFTPGGSSGGSAASLAAGTSALATGSDIAGSIRIPASACGLVGYKPPYGRNPDDPPFNLDFYCHTGPLARSVRDAITLQNVMCGPHPLDMSTLRPKLEVPTELGPIRGWRIAYSPNLGFYEVDREVERNTLAALDVLRSLGATVEEVDIGWTEAMLDAAIAYLEHLFGGYLSKLLDKHADRMTTYARAFAEASLNSTARDFVDSLAIANEMYETVGPLLQKYRLLACPTAALPAVPADFDQSTGTVRINGREVNPFLGWVMTVPFNMLSRCPVLTVPSGHASNRVPTGLQIVGRTYCDEDVFRAGLAYETEVGGWYRSAAARPAI